MNKGSQTNFMSQSCITNLSVRLENEVSLKGEDAPINLQSRAEDNCTNNASSNDFLISVTITCTDHKLLDLLHTPLIRNLAS